METYISQQKKQLLDSLENQARFSQLVAVVVGEKGTGKSFLIQQLQQRLEQELAIARIDASLAMTEDQLEKTISLQLGLNWQESEIGLEQRIQNNLPQKVLITIDDAQLLSSSCLDFILQLNQNQLQLQESVLFILLTGDSSLPSMINETNTFKQHQEMCVVFQIEPIEQHETKSMVADLCRHRPDWPDDLCEEKKLIYFWQLSKGNPAELNYHLSRWLEENTGAEVKIVEITGHEKTSYLKSILYVIIAGTLIGTLFFQEDVNQWIAAGSPNSQSIEKIPKDQVEQLASDVSFNDQDKAVKTDTTTQPADTKQQPIANETSDNNQQKHSLIKSQQTEGEKNVSDDSDLLKNDTAQNVSNEKREAEEKTVTKQPEITPAVVKQEIKEIVNSENASNLTADEASLLKLDDKLFVLQWMVLSKAQAVEDYKKNHPLVNKMTIYRRANSGKVLYLVISDQFLSRSQADVAKAEYNKRGFPGKPWVKSMASVKNEVKAFRDSLE